MKNYTYPHQFDTYHGTLNQVVHDQIICLKAIPQNSGHFRTQTFHHFTAPYRAAWWVFPEISTRDLQTIGHTDLTENQDGLHTHFHSFSNELNFNLHSVRKDGHAKLDYEKGAHGYQKLGWKQDKGLPLKFGHYYFFTLDVTNTKARLHVGSSYYSTKGTTLKWDLPKYANKSGAFGLRLDNIVAYFGGLTVTPIRKTTLLESLLP